MRRLKWLKSFDGSIIGEEFNSGEKSAENFVSQGYAEYIDITNIIQERKDKLFNPIEAKNEVKKIAEEYKEEGDDIILIPKIKQLAKNNNMTSTYLINYFWSLVKSFKKTIKQQQKEVVVKYTFEEKEENKDKDKKLQKIEVIPTIPKKPEESAENSKLNKFIRGDKTPARDEAIRYLTERAGLTEIYKEVEEDNYTFIERTADEIKKEEAGLRAEIKEILKSTQGQGSEIISELLAQYFKDNYKIFTIIDDKCEEVWIYEGGVYYPHGKSRILKILRRILRENLTPDRKSKVLIKIMADSFIDQKDFFNVNYLTEIPVQNGILDLDTREIKPFTPLKIFFNKLPMEYNKDAKCPNIETHFKSVLNGEDAVKVMFELFGYCLWKDNFLEKSVMFYAGGRNGKTKTLELLKTFIGPLNVVSVPLQNLSDNSFEISELFGKMVNMAGDISTEEIKHSGIIKMLTGRDTLTAKRKFLTGITFTNFSKLIFACNELPKVYDNSRGFWSRWIIFEFPYTFVKKDELDALPEEEKKSKKIMDPDIVKKLTTPEELSGLLNIALDGLDRIKANKSFSYSKGVDEVMNFWIRNSDSFLAFCLDYVEGDYSGKISKLDLRKKYVDYCKKYQVKTVSDKAIKRTLQDTYGVDEEYSSYLMGHQEWTWVGIKWKANPEIRIKG